MIINQEPSLISAAFIPETPAGPLGLAFSKRGLARLFFCSREAYLRFIIDHCLVDGADGDGLLTEALRQVREYFGGSRKAFDLPIDLAGQSSFRARALRVCAQIPFGQTTTYGDLAERSGSPKGARAAGGAMAHNPIALVIPCHRVVGHDGRLHGFSSPGGLAVKALLLGLEGVRIENERIC